MKWGAIIAAAWPALVLALWPQAAGAQAAILNPQGSGPILASVNWIQGTLLGNVATAVAVVAIAIRNIHVCRCLAVGIAYGQCLADEDDSSRALSWMAIYFYGSRGSYAG